MIKFITNSYDLEALEKFYLYRAMKVLLILACLVLVCSTLIDIPERVTRITENNCGIPYDERNSSWLYLQLCRLRNKKDMEESRFCKEINKISSQLPTQENQYSYKDRMVLCMIRSGKQAKLKEWLPFKG